MAELTLSRSARWYEIRPSDAAMAVLCAAAGLAVLASGKSLPGQVVLLAEFSALAGIAWWDSRTLRAPNVAVLPALAATLALSALFGADAALSASGGALVAFAAMAVLAAFGGGRLGGGDVKFGALCGAVCGLGSTLALLAAATIAGGVVAALVLALRLRKGSDVMAFTPLLLFGAIFALVTQGTYHQP